MNLRPLYLYLLLAIFTLQSAIVAADAISEIGLPTISTQDGPWLDEPSGKILEHQHVHQHNHQHKVSNDELPEHDEQHQCHGHFHFMAAILPVVHALNVRLSQPIYAHIDAALFNYYLSLPKRPPISA